MPEHDERTAQLAGLAAQLTEAWNSRDPRRVAALCAADYEGENVGEAAPHHGPEGMAASVSMYLAAFPDLHFTVDDAVIQGDRVVQMCIRATTRALMGIPASRTITIRSTSLWPYRGDKLYRLVVQDVARLLREIGLLPNCNRLIAICILQIIVLFVQRNPIRRDRSPIAHSQEVTSRNQFLCIGLLALVLLVTAGCISQPVCRWRMRPGMRVAGPYRSVSLYSQRRPPIRFRRCRPRRRPPPSGFTTRAAHLGQVHGHEYRRYAVSVTRGAPRDTLADRRSFWRFSRVSSRQPDD
jgi:predicted ester cyclase